MIALLQKQLEEEARKLEKASKAAEENKRKTAEKDRLANQKLRDLEVHLQIKLTCFFKSTPDLL